LTTAPPSVFQSRRWNVILKPSVSSIYFFDPSQIINPETIACTAYSRYILDVGQSEDWLALQMALAPCLIGYGAIARRLYTEEGTVREGNRYWKWIENYVAEDYTEAVRLGSGKLAHD
jgi:thiaminase